jgi:ketosteroid isomerase-like protein
MTDQEIRTALDRHWTASDANDFETEHDIYLEDAVLEYPQSGERIRGRQNIQITRSKQPSKKRFAVRRVLGGGELWITEYILSYDGKPSYTVSIMEFRGNKVARETQYFADPFEASGWRAQWVERMGDNEDWPRAVITVGEPIFAGTGKPLAGNDSVAGPAQLPEGDLAVRDIHRD